MYEFIKLGRWGTLYRVENYHIFSTTDEVKKHLHDKVNRLVDELKTMEEL